MIVIQSQICFPRSHSRTFSVRSSYRQARRAVKEKRVVFVACHQPLDDPAFAIPAQRSAVLCGRTNAALAMRKDKFDAALSQTLTKWIAIGSAVVDQAVENRRRDRLVEQRLG